MRWAPWLLLAALAGCSERHPPRRDCLARVWVEAADPSTVVGSWDGWATPGWTPDDTSTPGWKLARRGLPAGEHGYLLYDGAERRLDPHNPLTTFDGEREVSLLLVPDCATPRVAVDDVTVEGDRLSLHGRFLAAESGAALDPATVSAVTSDGLPLAVTADADTGTITAEARVAAEPGKLSVLLSARDERGVSAEVPSRAVAWQAPRARSWADAVIYQVVVDRFRADGGAALAPPPTPGSRAGGTLDGVTAALRDGYFDELGITALWLSPAYENPTEARLGNDGQLYEGYHGYWVQRSRAVDTRLGGEAALERLVGEAHARGVAVLLDVVPNHVYETNVRFVDNREAGWFSPAGCVCGTESCPWGTHMQQCWFTPYLPDVRWQSPDARAAGIDDVAWWLDRFDLDGVRIDAVPMMPRAATRRIAHRLRQEQVPEAATFLLGEVFTGPGPGGLAQLRYQLGPAGLNSVFDFPLMWALHDAIATGTRGFGPVEDMLQLQEQQLAGSGAVLARILDNHDTPRLLSVAHGDAHGDPWLRPAQQPTEPGPYERLRLAMAVVYTLPGAVVLYQGDEAALAGANDPDCRRVLPAVGALSDLQRSVRDTATRLGRLRGCVPALRTGGRRALLVEEQTYAYARTAAGTGAGGPVEAVVLVSTAAEERTLALPPGTLGDASWVDVDRGEPVAPDTFGGANLTMPPRSYRVLLRTEDPCR